MAASDEGTEPLPCGSQQLSKPLSGSTDPTEVGNTGVNQLSVHGILKTKCDMSIHFSGTISRSGGLSSAINKQLRGLTLKPVKRVLFKFDPFHDKVEQTRFFMFHITTPKVLKTNLSCTFKSEVLCDRSDPSISITLANGESVVFKSANLSALEMLTLFNKHISILAPKEEPKSAPVATKSAKKTIKGR